MKKVKGFDDATGMKIYGYGEWVSKFDDDLKSKLQQVYNKVNHDTKMTFPDIAEYNDTANHDNSFDAWYDWIVADMMNNPRVHMFRICLVVSPNEIMFADDDTCGFMDNMDWDEEDEKRWEEEYD